MVICMLCRKMQLDYYACDDEVKFNITYEMRSVNGINAHVRSKVNTGSTVTLFYIKLCSQKMEKLVKPSTGSAC